MIAVLDANIELALALPVEYSAEAFNLVQKLAAERVRIVVPTLWSYEVASGLAVSVYHKWLTREEALDALGSSQNKNYELVPPDGELLAAALCWAERLKQAKCYDAQYLALAENLGAHLWTADKHLCNNVQALGIDWVHWVGEYELTELSQKYFRTRRWQDGEREVDKDLSERRYQDFSDMDKLIEDIDKESP
jgi:predicted nucleic acid-binding protein